MIVFSEILLGMPATHADFICILCPYLFKLLRAKIKVPVPRNTKVKLAMASRLTTGLNFTMPEHSSHPA